MAHSSAIRQIFPLYGRLLIHGHHNYNITFTNLQLGLNDIASSISLVKPNPEPNPEPSGGSLVIIVGSDNCEMDVVCR